MKSNIFYQTQIDIPFHLADPAGVIFYGNISHLSHQSIEKGIQEVGIPWSTWFKNSQWAVPIRAVKSEFFFPLHAGQTYGVRLALTGIGNHSLTFSTEFTKEDRTCAKSESTHVFINLSSHKKISVPEEVLKVFKPYNIQF